MKPVLRRVAVARFAVQVVFVVCVLRAIMAGAVVTGAAAFPNAAPRLTAAPLEDLLINGVFALLLAVALWWFARVGSRESGTS